MLVMYPAIFLKSLDEKGYVVKFPDLDGCLTEGENEIEAMGMATDALCAYLYEYYIDKVDFPPFSYVSSVVIELDEEDKKFFDVSSSFVNYVLADITEYARKSENKAVKKTLSIPSYLNELGIARGINFSQVLQEALRDELNVN